MMRERAWRLHLQPYIDQRRVGYLRQATETVVVAKMPVSRTTAIISRRSIARLHTEDSYSFHDAVEQTCASVANPQGTQGKDGWIRCDRDLSMIRKVEPRPYEDIKMTAIAQKVFGVDPDFIAVRHHARQSLLTWSRTGKRPGGFCTSFPHEGPFIFMNASGTGGDIARLQGGHVPRFPTMEHSYLSQRRTVVRWRKSQDEHGVAGISVPAQRGWWILRRC